MEPMNENSSTSYPLVVRHMSAVLNKGGDDVEKSVLPQLAVLLVARGASQVVVPVPDRGERELVESAALTLPPERRRLVRLVDQDGDLFERVLRYLAPMHEQADKWPEDAFVNFCVPFLYESALGHQYKAGVTSDAVSVVRGFIPTIDPAAFRGEAKFRLAELVRLICAYEPAIVDQGLVASDVRRKTESALRLMQAAEFRSLVTESGRVGYLKHPLQALRELRHRFLQLTRLPVIGDTVTLASTAVDAASAGVLGKLAAEGLSLTTRGGSGYSPPFFDIGRAHHSLYRAVLEELNATPPKGTIQVFKSGAGIRWLNEGEEGKLDLDARDDEDRRRRHREALDALGRFV